MANAFRTRVVMLLAILLALAGMVLSGILLQHHVVARIGGDPLLSAVCNAASTFSCDEVIASKYGTLELARGRFKIAIPTAMLGFAYFAFIASWYIAVGMPPGRQKWFHLIPTLLLVGGVAGAAWFEYIMFFVLDKRCPLCIGTHVAILFIFVLTLLLWWTSRTAVPASKSAGNNAPETWPMGRMILSAFVLTCTASGLGWFIYQSQLHKGYSNAYFARWQEYDKDTRLNYDKFLAQPVLDIPIHPDDPVRGPADARHTVVVFSDFLCPACQAMEITVLEERRKEFPDQFRIVFKHFPLDKTCNPDLKNSLHPGACAGAVAVEAVRLLKGNDAFWTMHDAMFHNKGRFTTEFAYAEAAKLGIDRETYLKRIQTTSAWERVRANIAEGRKLGVESTPALYFDGRLLKPWGDRHMWKYLLSDETLKSATTRPAVTSQPASAPAAQAASK